MISLRNFTEADAEILQQKKYVRMSVEEVRDLIARWNTGNFHGHYFVVLAIYEDRYLVGMVSLFHYTDHIVSLRPEIFPEYRRRDYGKMAMKHVMGMAGEMGYEIVSQQIKVNNLSAIMLHKSLGFETDGYLYTDRNGGKVMVYLKVIQDRGH